MPGISVDIDPEIVNEDRVEGLISRFAESYRRNVPQVMAEFGEELSQEFVDSLREKILNQGFSHIPLNPAYLQSKIDRRLDPRILIATQEYLNSFVAERDEEADAGTIQFRCGVREGIHGPSGMTYKRLARVHEYGSGRIPARPHWRPHAAEFRTRAHQIALQLRARIAEAVKADLQD